VSEGVAEKKTRGRSKFTLTEMTRLAVVSNKTGVEIRFESSAGDVVRFVPRSKSDVDDTDAPVEDTGEIVL
jgi:hypothetical protein